MPLLSRPDGASTKGEAETTTAPPAADGSETAAQRALQVQEIVELITDIEYGWYLYAFRAVARRWYNACERNIFRQIMVREPDWWQSKECITVGRWLGVKSEATRRYSLIHRMSFNFYGSGRMKLKVERCVNLVFLSCSSIDLAELGGKRGRPLTALFPRIRTVEIGMPDPTEESRRAAIKNAARWLAVLDGVPVLRFWSVYPQYLRILAERAPTRLATASISMNRPSRQDIRQLPTILASFPNLTGLTIWSSRDLDKLLPKLPSTLKRLEIHSSVSTVKSCLSMIASCPAFDHLAIAPCLTISSKWDHGRELPPDLIEAAADGWRTRKGTLVDQATYQGWTRAVEDAKRRSEYQSARRDYGEIEVWSDWESDDTLTPSSDDSEGDDGQ